MKRFHTVFFSLFMVMATFTSAQVPNYGNEAAFNMVVLEASLKPFKKNDADSIRAVATTMFEQWLPLLRHADTVGVMLWTSDGSEILDYSGDLGQPLEWARYMGNPNTEHEVGAGPTSLSIHERAYLYMDDPPEYTYADLKFIVGALKEIGKELTGKVIQIGATFDPGPEFAKSEFKYKKHPEILGGNAMGHKTFVSCYSVLNADNGIYAGFPDGIPGQTPFGTFFGRQSQHFLADLDFDYIWFSNGFGFGAEGWSATGATFDGKAFNTELLPDFTAQINEFWQLFRAECPDFPIQTRGTNLSTGADLARDAVDLRGIYSGNFNMLPPPNSPWAALDGDFGLELTGYMSRMAELPDHRFPFRYYTHDPWWINSPWLDRYGREPHDIYLPMAVARIDSNGQIGIPTHLNFLTIDDTFGNMPEQVPNEVIPHILKARYDRPTAPGPLVWVYPFDEYHDWAYRYPERLPEVYYGDWVIRQAINHGLPLNTVISTASFVSVADTPGELFSQSILVSIAPDSGSPLERALIAHVEQGGKLIIYGPVERSSEAFRELLNLKNTTAIEGEVDIEDHFEGDVLEQPYPKKTKHSALFSAGGISTQIDDPNDPYTRLNVRVSQNGEIRDMVWTRSAPAWNGGKVGYIRATNSSSFKGGRLLTPDDPEIYFHAPVWLRYLLQEFGLYLGVDKVNPTITSPVFTISRSDNAYFFSGYQPNNTVKNRFRLPQGAPILLGFDTRLERGQSTYVLPTAWNRECRVFVEQTTGMVNCKELHSGELGISRRLQVGGLEDAIVRIYPPEEIMENQFHAYVNAHYPWREGKVGFSLGDPKYGHHYVVENVTGTLVVSWQ